MSNANRAWISLLVAGIVLLVVMLTMPIYKIEPCAFYLPTITKAPYSGQVAVYDARTEPFDAKTVGFINLSYHINEKFYASYQNQTLILDQLKKMAASGGGNGVVLERAGQGGEGPMLMFMVTAKVIYTANNPSS